MTPENIEQVPANAELQGLLEHYRNGRFDEAEKSARAISKKFPHHNFSWKVLAAVLKQSGRLEEELLASKRAVELAPGDPEAHNNLGASLLDLGRLEEAEACFRSAIALEQDYAEAHYNLGVTLHERGLLQQAEASYGSAIALRHDYAEAYSNLGVTLRRLRRLDEAEANCRIAVALRPDIAESHSNLGVTLQELGRLEEAEASYRNAIALGPEFAEVHSNLGVTLRQLGRLEEAEASCRNALALEHDHADAHFNLGVALHELGRLEESVASYRNAISHRPDYAEAWSNLGVTLQALGRLDEADASCTRAIALKPGYGEAMLNRAQVQFDKGNFEAALRGFDSCNTRDSRARALVSLYALGRIEDIYKRIEAQADTDRENIWIAAISAFLAAREKKDTAHDFCKNPLDFIHFSNISAHLENPALFIAELIEELGNVRTSWEPFNKTTRKGFQSRINIFKNPAGKLGTLKSIIFNELDSYHSKFRDIPCSFIQNWPAEKNIVGWHVILKQFGYQDTHIHPNGWLSGVVYLKVTAPRGMDEGAIEFSLNGEHYSDIDSPKITWQPELGDMVFFPSSLHHRTIPYTTDADRIIVSFDLVPDSGGGRDARQKA